VAAVTDFPLAPESGFLPAQANDPAAPPPVPAVRASDKEREQVVQVLQAACAEGRLTFEELGMRVEAAYSAVTRGDLVPLTSDLPTAATEQAALPVEPPLSAPAKTKRKWLVSVMSSHKHSGHWRLPARTNAVTFMGEMNIDLRDAMIESPDIAMTLYVMMGECSVTVPKGVEVEVTGFVFMGEKKVDVASTRPRPGVPRLHLRVIGTMGEVKIRTA
jgi:hypothetical protein